VQKRPQREDPEQGGLPQETGVPTQRGDEHEPVHEAVGVVGDEHRGHTRDDRLAVVDLDPSEEDVDQQPAQGSHDAVGDPAHGRSHGDMTMP
jgi:hypothetical protein